MVSGNVNYDKQEPSSKGVGVSVFVTVVFLVGIVIGSYYLFVSLLSVDQNAKYEYSKTILKNELDHEYQKNLQSLMWVDRSKGIVKVPIQAGVDAVIEAYNP